jgi:Niemann-Pick C1 protein
MRSADEITVYVESQFAEGMYNSCAQVTVPSVGSALRLLCGTVPEDCSPVRLLSYMGSKSNGQSPSQFNFQFVNKTSSQPEVVRAMNDTIYPCNARGYGDSEPCTCMDCDAACPISAQGGDEGQELDTTWLIMGVPAYILVAAVIYIAVSSIFLVVSYMHSLYYKKEDEDDECANKRISTSLKPQIEDNARLMNGGARNSQCLDDARSSEASSVSLEIGVFEQVGLSFQKLLNRFFYRWGLAMAQQPIAALLFGCMVVAICSNGLSRVKWTTDPVELWSSSSSLAYREMQHYNQNFGPFFRIEQVIVRPKNGSFVFNEKASSRGQFGPVFDKRFLHKLMDLQDNITSIVAYSSRHERNVTLKDICHKPMAPYNPNCAVMSPTEWFQNDRAKIDKQLYNYYGFFVADHYDHLTSCVEAPAKTDDGTALKMSCLASWGAPIDPMVVLGGFPDEYFRNATAAIVTFLVTNNNDARQNELAEDWESEFLHVVDKFSRENPDLILSYQAQRSIQDEIERASKGDIQTILASYLIMFGYITVCLGKVARAK